MTAAGRRTTGNTTIGWPPPMPSSRKGRTARATESASCKVPREASVLHQQPFRRGEPMQASGAGRGACLLCALDPLAVQQRLDCHQIPVQRHPTEGHGVDAGLLGVLWAAVGSQVHRETWDLQGQGVVLEGRPEPWSFVQDAGGATVRGREGPMRWSWASLRRRW